MEIRTQYCSSAESRQIETTRLLVENAGIYDHFHFKAAAVILTSDQGPWMGGDDLPLWMHKTLMKNEKTFLISIHNGLNAGLNIR